MEIIVAKTAGFCFGVQNAVDKTLSADGKVVTFGEIIHNDLVVDKLKEKLNSIDINDILRIMGFNV